MRTVEKISQEKQYAWLNNTGYANVKELAQQLENNRFIVQQIFRTGVIRCKLPDWYILKPDNQTLIYDIHSNTWDFQLTLIKIGTHSFFVKA